MSPWSLVTPCLGPDTLASLCAACDAASEGKCGDPVPWYSPGAPGEAWGTGGSDKELLKSRMRREMERRDGGLV